jgi:hypothetical protein
MAKKTELGKTDKLSNENERARILNSLAPSSAFFKM